MINVEELLVLGLGQGIRYAAISFSWLYFSLFLAVPCIGLFCFSHVIGIISVFIARH